jgi:hypothetical protein
VHGSVLMRLSALESGQAGPGGEGGADSLQQVQVRWITTEQHPPLYLHVILPAGGQHITARPPVPSCSICWSVAATAECLFRPP